MMWTSNNKSDDNAIIDIIEKKDEEKKQYPKYTEILDSLYDPNGPNFIKEDKVQYDFKQLLNNLDKINDRDEVKLKGLTNHQSFIKTTTRDRLRLDLDQITDRIIPILNSDTYDFAKNSYGDVDVWTDKNNNEEIKYELFLWDRKNFFEIKFLVHVIKFVDPKYASKYGVKNSPYLFPTYQIGIPSEDQMIPDPMGVIPTANMEDSGRGICTKDPLPIKYLYINRVTIQNSTLVVNYYKNMYPYPILKASENGNGLGGVTDMKLDYIKVKGDNNPIYQTGKEYNKWIKLDEEPDWEGQYPCKAPPFNKWNEEGVYYYEKGQGAIPEGKCAETCAGTRWSSMGEPLQPNFWIANYQSQPCGESYYLFDNARSLPGVFFGGGKR